MTNIVKKNTKSNVAKINTKTIVFPIVLKSIVAHTFNDDATFNRNDKQIRATLRANDNAKKIHSHRASWIATNMREYDTIRRAFDRAYDTRVVNASKRNTTSRATKRDTKTNVVVETPPATIDA